MLPHFFVSATYLHTVIYHSFSSILPVAWSLEVEVQFYILAPLFFLIFAIPSNVVRRIIFLIVIIAGSYYWFDYWRVGNVFIFFHFFFIGLLLTDLYCTGTVLMKNKVLGLAVGMASLAGFLFIPSIYYEADRVHFGVGYLVKMVCMFFLFHSALTNPYMKKLFSAELITTIGGMCYSIYLLHFAIISATGTVLLKAGLVFNNKLYFPFYFIFLISLVLLISAIYFLLIEKPFMRPMGMLKKS